MTKNSNNVSIPAKILEPVRKLFSTGIKVLDLLAPLAQGGKAALFGGAGVGKTVLITRNNFV